MWLFTCTCGRIITLFVQTIICLEESLQTFNCCVCLSINFDLWSDFSAWIKALGPRNRLELTGISSYPISNYPKLIWLLYEGNKSCQKTTTLAGQQPSLKRSNCLSFFKSRSNFKVKVTRSKIMVPCESSCHKEYTCAIWKPYLLW